MIEAIDWATAENTRAGSKYFGKLDPSKFAVAGMSCGGLQALEVAPDPRVKTLMVMNSGLFGADGRPKMAPPKEGMPKMGAPKEGMPNAAAPKQEEPPLLGMLQSGKRSVQNCTRLLFIIMSGEKDIAYRWPLMITQR
jgi:hypothetical protein